MNLITNLQENKSVMLLFIILVLLSCNTYSQRLDPNKQLTQYTIDSWGDEKGLLSGGVTAILQAENGYIWLGTFNGVFKLEQHVK